MDTSPLRGFSAYYYCIVDPVAGRRGLIPLTIVPVSLVRGDWLIALPLY